MDVEGFEASVLNGGKKFFKDIPFIVTEFVVPWISERGGDPMNMLEWLELQNFQLSLDGFNGGKATKAQIMEKCQSICDLWLSKRILHNGT
jgi:hypothetical protein